MAKVTKTAAAAATSATAGKTYRVLINKDDTPGGKSDVVLTINGRNVQIQRGKEVLLSEAMMEVLRNAEIRGYEACSDGKTAVVSGMPRFSYVVLGTVEAAVVEDAAETTKDDGVGSGDADEGGDGAAS